MRPPYRVGLLLGQFSFGGAERQTDELVRRVDRREFEPISIVLSAELDPYGPALQRDGFRVIALPRRGRNDLTRLWRLRRLLHELQLDLIYGIGYEPSAVGWFARFGRRRPPLIPSIRSTVIDPPFPKPQIYRQMFARVPAITSNSARGAAFAAATFGAPVARTTVIPNGFDIDELLRKAEGDDLRGELGLAPGTPLIGFVGKDSWQKNVRRFLEVTRAVHAARPEAHVVLVGWKLAEADRERLGAGGAHLHLLGVRTDIYRIMRSLDVVVMTSDTEGCPNVVIEAGVLGTPVVAPDVGDVPQIFGAEAADRLVLAQQIDDYRDAVLRLLAKRPDDISKTAAWRDRLRVDYSASAMVQRTESVFRRVLETKL